MKQLPDISIENTKSDILFKFLDTLPLTHRRRDYFMRIIKKQPEIQIKYITYDFAPKAAKYKIEVFPYTPLKNFIVLTESQIIDYLDKHSLLGINLREFIENTIEV